MCTENTLDWLQSKIFLAISIVFMIVNDRIPETIVWFSIKTHILNLLFGRRCKEKIAVIICRILIFLFVFMMAVWLSW